MHRNTLMFAIVLTVFYVLFSNPRLLAHTFSENENALFLTMIDKIKAEVQLVDRNISNNNTQQSQNHAKAAAELLNQNDPVVNTTWTIQISERNPRVATDLLNSLKDLRSTVASSLPSSSTNSSTVKSQVTNIGNLLDEAVSVRVSNDIVNNPKTQALILANLGNEIYNNYGNALGLPPSTIASIGGMKMSGMNMNMSMSTPSKSDGSTVTSGMNMGGKGSSMNMSSGSSNGGMSGMNMTNGRVSGMNSMNEQVVLNQNNPPIKNLTAYETAQSLASVTQLAFSKNFKPVAPASAIGPIVNLEKYFNDLKNSINNKTSFMTVMELVHIKLHPILITAYNLTTG